MSSKVLVIGDAITDVYREFDFRKECPDAPGIPAAIQVNRDVRPGGAANVAINLAALGPDIEVHLISVLSLALARAIQQIGLGRIDLRSSVITHQDNAISKERIIIDGLGGNPFIARLDNRLTIDESDAELIENRLDCFLKLNTDIDLIILSDYAGGVMTEGVLALLSPFRERLMVDTKRTDLSCFAGSLLAKLNAEEYLRVLLADPSPERYFRYFVVTRGELGSRLIIRKDFDEQRPTFPYHVFGSGVVTTHFQAKEVEAVDVCGCGDTFLAGLAAGLVRYQDPFEAVSFANAAAATVVVQPRTAVANLQKTLEMTGRKAV